MDAISQIVLGAAVTAAVAPARHRRTALVLGAALGTLPDLDVLPLALVDDPVKRLVWHRGASHSLFVLPFVGWALWALGRSWSVIRAAPRRWFLAIQAALLTHSLLDALTIYGTQLTWPLMPHPVMVGSVFIIDPLYTVWLLAACLAAWVLGERRRATHALAGGLLASTLYLGWSLTAKWVVEREAERSLAALGLEDAPRFSVPMPFNTLLWRVVVMTPEGYVEGLWSLFWDEGPILFVVHANEMDALDANRSLPAVQRLSWFNRGFMKAAVEDRRLVLSDLRMGYESDYVFSFEVAEFRDGSWHEIPPVQRPWPRETWGHVRQHAAELWHTLRNRPEQ